MLKPLALLPAVGRKGGTCRFIGAIPRRNPITTLSPLALSDDQLAQVFRCAGAAVLRTLMPPARAARIRSVSLSFTLGSL